MYKFLIKTPSVREANVAVDKILAIRDGNHLTVTSGYIGGKDRLIKFARLLDWLRVNPDRYLHLIFGVRGIYSEATQKTVHPYLIEDKHYEFRPGKGSASYLMDEMGDTLTCDAFPDDLITRIMIWGVQNYHAKAICLSHQPSDSSAKPQALAALMGSSNFTDAALYKPFGFEMDLYMEAELGAPDEMLESFQKAFMKLVSESFDYTLNDATLDFETRILTPVQTALYSRWLEE